jgi:hypothetical protein
MAAADDVHDRVRETPAGRPEPPAYAVLRPGEVTRAAPGAVPGAAPGGSRDDLTAALARAPRHRDGGPRGVRPKQPDKPPPLNPAEPIPDDPGPLMPDSPDDLPPAPVEPSPDADPAEPEPEPV